MTEIKYSCRYNKYLHLNLLSFMYSYPVQYHISVIYCTCSTIISNSRHNIIVPSMCSISPKNKDNVHKSIAIQHAYHFQILQITQRAFQVPPVILHCTTQANQMFARFFLYSYVLAVNNINQSLSNFSQEKAPG